MKKTGVKSQKLGISIKNKKPFSMRHVLNAVKICLLFAVFCLSFAVGSYASGNRITSIEVIDNAVKVKVDGAINYKLFKTPDPFKVVVDMEGVEVGNFAGKIYSQKEGITEVTLTQVNNPAPGSRLDILLQSPADIKPEVKGDTLILSVVPTGASNIDEKNTKTYAQAHVKASDVETKSMAKEIKSTSFSKTETGIEFIIKGDAMMPEPAVFELDGKIIIDIPSIIMNASLPTTILPPVKDIKYKSEKEGVRFIIDIQGKPLTEVFAIDDELIVDIAFKEGVLTTKKEEAKGVLPELKSQKAGLISLDFQDADVVPILRLLGDVSGYNIVVHPDVKGKITMKLMNVPWEQALDIVLETFNLEKVVEGNIIRISPVKAIIDSASRKEAIAKDNEATAKIKENADIAEDLEIRVFPLKYVSSIFPHEKEPSDFDRTLNDVLKRYADQIKAMLSKRGSIGYDVRTRSLFVKDIKSNMKEIEEKVINTLNKDTSQFLLEVKIVEINMNFSKSLGINWGGHYRPNMGDENTTISGGLGTTITGGQNIGVGLVNLPANTTRILTPTSAITLGYLNAMQTFGLDLRLSAIEDIGKAKLLSTPKVVTFGNEPAIIRHGRRIPITTPGRTQGTYTTTYIDANLRIIVIPQLASDNTIFMKLEVAKDEPDYTNRNMLGNPAIDTRSVVTQVLVRDGETVVIGGILKSSESNNDSGVPGISKIPLLGWLFKRETKETSSDELLIFITPRIVKR